MPFKLQRFSTGGGAPTAKTVTVPNTTGAIYTIARLLGSTSTFSLLSSSNANLAVASSTGVVSATAAIGVGTSQLANVREVNTTTGIAVEYPLTLSGGVVVPAAPFITITPGNAQNTITWADGSTGGAAITAHKLYRSTTTGTEVLVGTITTASPYIDTGLTNGTQYFYKLSAVNSVGEGALSAEASGTPSISLLSQVATGASGLWMGYDYAVTNSIPRIKNRAAATPPTTNNLLPALARYSNGQYFQSGNITFTEGQANALDGTNNATNCVCSAGSWFIQTISAPPGIANGTQVTFSIDMMTTDASTATVRIGTSTNVTVTGTMTSFSATYTYSGFQIPIVVNVGSVAANLRIGNARLHLGPADLGRDTLGGHMVFGKAAGATQPGTSTLGLIDVSNSTGGLVQFPVGINLNAFTFIGIGSISSVAGSSAYAFGDAFSYSTFLCNLEDGAANGGAFNGAIGGSTVTGNAPGLIFPRANELHAITTRYGDGNLTFFEDDAKAVYKADSGKTPGSRQDFLTGIAQFGGTSNAKYAAWALWPRALTDAEVRTSVAAMIADLAANASLTVAPNTYYAVAAGDSRTAAVGVTGGLGSYQDRGGPLTVHVNGTDAGNSGAKLGASGDIESANTLYGYMARDLGRIPTNKRGKRYRLSVFIGYNDWNGAGGGGGPWAGNPTGYAAAVSTYCAAMKAGGYDDIFLCTELPATSAGYNTWRNTLNGVYTGAGWAATNGVTLIRFDQVTGMGADADASNTTNYGDGIHPTAAGQELLKTAWAAAVDA